MGHFSFLGYAFCNDSHTFLGHASHNDERTILPKWDISVNRIMSIMGGRVMLWLAVKSSLKE